MSKLFIFNKPYGVLSQFTAEGRWRGLTDYIDIRGIYVAGRLDADSEGLLLLTDDGRLQATIADPRFKMEKTYWAQVEGMAEDGQLEPLRTGVDLGEFRCKPAQASVIGEPHSLWPRDPPIRFRKNVPTSWLEIRIAEGKNRQVRRMTAAVGLPTLRLVRVAIGGLRIDELRPGQGRLFEAGRDVLLKTIKGD